MGTGALLSVIVVHHQAGVNDSWDPAKQCQNQTEKETGNATGHKHRHRRQDNTEKISQRFHWFDFLLAFVSLFAFLFFCFTDSPFCNS
jgi:hypothetical protein